MRAVALVALALVACQAGPPEEFGVNLTVKHGGLAAAVLARIVSADVSVTGDEVFATALDVEKLKRGDLRVRYVPAITEGTLVFRVAASARDGLVIAAAEEMIALVPNQAVALTLALVEPPPLDRTLPDGSTCTMDAECKSGHCVDDVCCVSFGCPACHACGATGQCDVAIVSAPDDDSCSNELICDATSTCVPHRSLGKVCTLDGECASGHCVDGVCCDTACDGACRACNLPAMEGACSPLVMQQEPLCHVTTQGAFMCNATGECTSPHLLKTISTNPAPSAVVSTFTHGFFAADDGVNGRELWITDGTEAGTHMLSDLYPGPTSSNPTEITSLGNVVIYAADDALAPGKRNLFISDGTFAGTTRLANLGNGANANPTSLTRIGNLIYFAATANGTGVKTYVTDGTTAGTGLFFGTDGSAPAYFAALGTQGAFVFQGIEASLARELYYSNGTTAGTMFLKDCFVGGSNGIPSFMTPFGNKVIFSAKLNDAPNGTEPWITDGTAGGTNQIVDVGASGSSSPLEFTVIGSVAYFSALGSNADGRELWSTDGTAPNTLRVKDIYPLPNLGSDPQNLYAWNGVLYFSATDVADLQALWRTDSTPEGTYKVVSTAAPVTPGTPPATGSQVSNLVGFGDHLFFRGNVTDTGPATLWHTDGTELGSARSCPASGDCQNPGSPSVAAGHLYFTAEVGGAQQLYVFP